MILEKKLISNGICVILINDSIINNDNYNELEEAFNELINVNTKKYILNFQKVLYVSSISLKLFTFILKRVKKINGRILFICISNSVQEFLEITRLSKILEIYKNEELAIKILSDEELER